MAREIEIRSHTPLAEYEALGNLSGAVAQLRLDARALVPRIGDRPVWMVNSTATGGGVAEMLPHVIALLQELGVDAHWAVMETDQIEFFALTKSIHNMLHDAGPASLSAGERALYDEVSRESARQLGTLVHPGSIVVIHDPQPLGAGAMLKEQVDVRLIWRCHIGLDDFPPRVTAAWDFLRPYLDSYEHAVFSVPEYVPNFLAERASIIHPGIDPLSHKNRELRPHKLAGVLYDSGLAECAAPVVAPRWEETAKRLQPDGTFGSAMEPEEIGLPSRPCITQVSRWDRLKGFEPLLEAFVVLKNRIEKNGARPAGDDEASNERYRRSRDIVRLVLAGPDPASVADDPEGRDAFERLRERYMQLAPDVQRDIAILSLPMGSRKLNALMVNALQRSSVIVVQNSIREGFGLTLTEAMWKGTPVLGNTRAAGLRQQVRDGVDGRMIDDPEDTAALAAALDEMLAMPDDLEHWAQSAQRRVYDEFLIFTQLRRWLEVLAGS